MPGSKILITRHRCYKSAESWCCSGAGNAHWSPKQVLYTSSKRFSENWPYFSWGWGAYLCTHCIVGYKQRCHQRFFGLKRHFWMLTALKLLLKMFCGLHRMTLISPTGTCLAKAPPSLWITEWLPDTVPTAVSFHLCTRHFRKIKRCLKITKPIISSTGGSLKWVTGAKRI